MEKTMTNMTKKKSCGLLIIGAVMLIAGIILAVYSYNTSYQEALTPMKSFACSGPTLIH